MTSTLILSNAWILLGLITLPALWWLFRLTSPSPRRIFFPAVRLLKDLRAGETTRVHIPPWLMILRLAAVALLVLGLAGPVLNPPPLPAGQGPVLLLLDNGWASAPDWAGKKDKARDLIAEAERQQRKVVLLPTAEAAPGAPPLPAEPVLPDTARDRLDALEPVPWTPRRARLFETLADGNLPATASAVWLSDGLDYGDARRLEQRLLRFSGITAVKPLRAGIPPLLLPPSDRPGAVAVAAHRFDPRAETEIWLRAEDENGRQLARYSLEFEAGAARADGEIALPLELRNRIARFRLESASTAAAVWLTDDSDRRVAVGIPGEETRDRTRPLLDEDFYIERALANAGEIRRGRIEDLVAGGAGAIVLGDRANFTDSEQEALERWIADGGVLIRFSGEALAARSNGALLPAPMRLGGRAMGGAMTWDQPASLAPFDGDSPFFGLAVPDDVTITRQILAEPGAGTAEVWARLTDGTPLVTARAAGGGWLVLFHVKANPDWSNLPLSGLYVQMLDRLTSLAATGGASKAPAARLEPVALLDGYGHLTADTGLVRSLPADALDQVRIGPETPPGLYGKPGRTVALNVTGPNGLDTNAADPPKPIGALNPAIETRFYTAPDRIDLRPWLVLAALALWLADFAATLWLRGGHRRPAFLTRLAARGRRAGARAPLWFAAFLAAAALLGHAGSAHAQDAKAQKAVGALHFGYIDTADRGLDAAARNGLARLGEALSARSSVRMEAPMALDLERDDLILFPLIYWPVTAQDRFPSERGLAKLNGYLDSGGILVLDTGGRKSAQEWMRAVLEQLDIGPLTPVPDDHVLRRTFYLINDFPGRMTGRPVWVEQAPPDAAEHVSPIVIGDHDWAEAWWNAAAIPFSRAGGGTGQREAALRFGINLAMYALTGNYKADQVHLPVVMERLGQ